MTEQTTGRHAAPTPPPTAEAVVLAAIAVPLPCPVCGRTKPCRCLRPDGYSPARERAALVVAALREHGHLPAEVHEHVTTVDNVHDTARWLADWSRHPRYTTEGGWHRLMQSEADVDMAFTQASRTATNDELATLNAARRVILDWTRVHGWEEPRG